MTESVGGPTFNEVRDRLSGHPAVVAVDRVPMGHSRIQTVFLYPDGHSVDVFVSRDGWEVTDFGESIQYLLDLGSFSDRASTYPGVNLVDGALVCPLDGLDQLPDLIVRVALACVAFVSPDDGKNDP